VGQRKTRGKKKEWIVGLNFGKEKEGVEKARRKKDQ